MFGLKEGKYSEHLNLDLFGKRQTSIKSFLLHISAEIHIWGVGN